MAFYNKKFTADSSQEKLRRTRNKIAKIKEIKQNEEIDYRSVKELLAEIYKPQNFDINNPQGIVILNSGDNYKKTAVTHQEPKKLTELLKRMHEQKVFDTINQKTTSAKQMVDKAVDLNGKINVNTSQKIDTISSVHDVVKTYENLNDVIKKQGKIFIYDTETYGGTSSEGIWTPRGITEFSMREIDLKTNKTVNTNILIGIMPTKENTDHIEEVLKLLKSGTDKDIAKLKSNEGLRVTANRLALYATAEFQKNNKGYYEITSLPASGSVNWLSHDTVEKGYKNLLRVWEDTDVNEHGIKTSIAEMFEASIRMMDSLNDGTGIAGGQNFDPFDQPIYNMQLKQFQKAYTSLANGDITAKNILKSNKEKNIDANKAVGRIKTYMDRLNGGIVMPTERALDFLPIARTVREIFGLEPMYAGNKDIIKKAGMGTAKQEYIGEAFFPELFETGEAHMADFDTKVLENVMLKNLPQLNNKTLLQYYMEDIGGKGIVGLANDEKPLEVGTQLFYVKKGTSRSYAGKGQLNYVSNDATGEMFFDSGHQFVNGKYLKYDSNINMGTNLTKGQLYYVNTINKINANDISPELHEIMPDLSSPELYHVEFKMAADDKHKELRDLSYHMYFNSKKQMGAFFSGGNVSMVATGKKGSWENIIEENRDLLEIVEVNDNGGIDYISHYKGLSDKGLVAENIARQSDKVSTSRTYNAIFDNDKAYKKIQQIMDIQDYLEKQGLTSIKKDELISLFRGKQVRDLNKDQSEKIMKDLNKLIGFDPHIGDWDGNVLYGNTQVNMANAYGLIQARRPFYDKFFKAFNKYASDNNLSDDQKSFLFKQSMENIMLENSMDINGIDENTRMLNDATMRTKGSRSLAEMKSIYEVRIPENFAIGTSDNILKINTLANPLKDKDVVSFNISEGKNNISIDMVKQITNRMYGNKRLIGDSQVHQREAMKEFVNKVLPKDKNFSPEQIKALKAAVAESDFNPDQVAREIISTMRDIKNTKIPNTNIPNIKAGIIKDVNIASIKNNIGVTMGLNKMSDDTIEEALNMVTSSYSTKKMTKDDISKLVKNRILPMYMPNKQEFLNGLIDMSEDEKIQRTLLYSKVEEAMTKQLTELVDMGTSIKGASIRISPRGDFGIQIGNELARVKALPKIENINGTLVAKIGHQRINLNLELDYGTNSNKVITNMGYHFKNAGLTTARIKKEIEDGTFTIDSLSYYTNSISKELRESASYSGTMEDYISNLYINTKNFDTLIPKIVGKNGTLKNVLEEAALPKEVVDKLADLFDGSEIIKPGEMDPQKNHLIGPYRITLIDAYNKVIGKNQEVDFLADVMTSATKDKSKFGKQITIGSQRFETGFWTPYDDNSRPVIYSSGHVHYYSGKQLDKITKAKSGLLHKGSIFQSGYTKRSAIKHKDYDDFFTEFTARTAYLSHKSIIEILDDNKERLKNVDFGFQSEEAQEKAIDFLYGILNTFEQAKVMDASIFESVTGDGVVAADKKILSVSKDIGNAIDLDNLSDVEQYKRLLDLRGSLEITDGVINYKSATGYLLEDGEAVIPIASFGGGTENWVNKMSKGLLRFQVMDEDGMVLADDIISEILNEHAEEFAALRSNQAQAFALFDKIFEERGYRAAYVIEDVNKITLPKILLNDSEKSMNQLVYARMGSLDKNVAAVMEAYSPQTKKMIGHYVPTMQAIDAMFRDQDKLDQALEAGGFKSYSDFLDAVKKEALTPNKMLFGKGGLFEGFASIGNDNVSGHGNKGTIIGGSVNNAITMVGKHSNGGVENHDSLMLGMQKFVERYNSSEKYKFIKDQDGKGIDLQFVDDHIELINGARIGEELDKYETIDNDRLRDLMKNLNDTILKNAPEADKLVHTVDGKEIIGSLVYINGKQYNGSVGAGTYKFVHDAETQSGLGEEYFAAKKKLYEAKSRKRKFEKSIKEGQPLLDGQAFLGDIDKQREALDFEIDSWKQRVLDFDQTGHTFKIGDQERNILMQYRNNDGIIKSAIRAIDSGEIKEDVIKKNRSLRDIRNMEGKDTPVYKFLIDELKEKHYYNPMEEDELTPELLATDEYKHLSPIYKDITEERGIKLGTDNAQEIYDLRMALAANDFNNGQVRPSLEYMKSQGFDVMSPEEYYNKFGSMHAPNYDSIVKDNVIIDFGENFASVGGVDNRYLAIPGLGTVTANGEVKQEWHKKVGSLITYYNDEYKDILIGKPDVKDEKTLALLEKFDAVRESTDRVANKGTILHSRTKLEVDAPTDRTKIMTTPNIEKNALLKNAMVDGESLAYWEANDVHYDYAFDSYESFYKRGYFSPEKLAEFGMKDESEMIEFLQTHGTIMVDDRFPNIIDTSMLGTRHYLDTSNMLANNATYYSPITVRKFNGDSDGDSASKISIRHKEADYALYQHRKLQAIEEAKNISFANAKAEDQWIRNKVISLGIDEEVYDDFHELDVNNAINAVTINKDMVGDVEGIHSGDLVKNINAQTIMNGPDQYNIAELKGGTSVLGREKLPSLNYDPTAKQVDDNLKRLNSVLEMLQADEYASYLKDKRFNGRFDEILTGKTDFYRDFDNETKALDTMLTALKELQNKNASFFDDEYIKYYEGEAKKRVRINNYQMEATSKLGITATGNVNSNLFGLTQAAKDVYGNDTLHADTFDLEKSFIISGMNREIEQAPISSKKAFIKAGDTRLLDFNEIWEDIKKNGMGDIRDKESGRYMMTEWIRDKVDHELIKKQYRFMTTRAGIERLPEDQQVDYMINAYMEHVAPLVEKHQEFRAYSDIHKLIGRGSANAHSIGALQYAQNLLNSGSLASEALRDLAVFNNQLLSSREKTTPGINSIPHQKTISQVEAQQAKEVSEAVVQNTGKVINAVSEGMETVAKNMKGNGVGAALTMATLGLASGLIAAGYASGNPLNDANPENVAQESTNNQLSFGPDAPQMVPNNTGGYIINIKGDTSKGNRQLKRALKQATKSSVGGDMNINMSLKTTQSGGYSNKDIENILSDYF